MAQGLRVLAYGTRGPEFESLYPYKKLSMVTQTYSPNVWEHIEKSQGVDVGGGGGTTLISSALSTFILAHISVTHRGVGANQTRNSAMTLLLR